MSEKPFVPRVNVINLDSFDIEDAEQEIASPDVDFREIEEEIETNDFVNAMDLFSTDELDPSDPDKIDPTLFNPQTVGDFKTLKLALIKIINQTPPEYKTELIKQLLASLTQDYKSKELKLLIQKFAVNRL